MPNSLVTSILVFMIWPVSGFSCPILSETQQITEAREERVETERSVKDLWNESDQVLIGRVMSSHEETRPASEIHPMEGTDSERAGQVVFGKATIEPMKELKGTALNPTTLTYTRDESTFEINCGAVSGFRTIGYLMETYRYLLYIRNGEVLRANLVVDWFSDLDAQEEMKMLRINGKSEQ